MDRRTTLEETLRARRVMHLLDDAHVVDAWHDADERMDAATRLIREVMIEHVLRRITFDERNAVLDVLSFARPRLLPVDPRVDEAGESRAP